MDFNDWLKIERGEMTQAEFDARNKPTQEPTPVPTQEPTQAPKKDDTEIAKEAKEQMSNLRGFFALIFLVIVVIYWSKIPGSDSNSTIKNSFTIGSERTILKDWVGCKDKGDLESIKRYVSQNDDIAYKKQMIATIGTGRCIFLEHFDEVYIVDIDSWGGVVKIRKKGDTNEYWTYKNAIRPKI